MITTGPGKATQKRRRMIDRGTPTHIVLLNAKEGKWLASGAQLRKQSTYATTWTDRVSSRLITVPKFKSLDIEMDSPRAPFTSVKRALPPLLLSTSTKRVKLDMPQNDLTSLNAALNRKSMTLDWPTKLQQASEDPPNMTVLLSTVLNWLLSLWAETTAKYRFIPPLFPEEEESILEGFNPDERRELEDVIKICVESGDWSDLITHPRLQPVAITHKNRRSSETTSEQAIRLHVMFSRKYRGDFHKLLVGALDDYQKIYDPQKHFGRFIPIIQSSATGKSRLVKEMGKEVPTLSICFRGSSLPESGWPPPDIPACDFLQRERPKNKRFKGEELAAAFLGAVMAVVAEKIEARGDSAPQEGDWMYDWHPDPPTNIFNSRRHTSFAEVAAGAEKLLLDNFKVIVDTRVSYKMQDVVLDDTALDYAPVWHKRLFELLCHPYFEKLSQILKKRNVKWFVLAVDECSQLNSTKPVPVVPCRTPFWSMSLIALRRIIKAYDDFVCEVPIWFLLLDTDLSVIDMSPLGREAPSDGEKGYKSLPVWPYVGFNQMAERDVFVDKKKLPTDVHSMQYLKLYGRPYWSMLTDDEVFRIASMKLFSDEGFRPYNEDHVFAAFSVRVGLEIGVGEASERLAVKAVCSHMHILEAVVDSMVLTTSTPEPMLAIAAAVEMNHSEETYKTALGTLIDKLILKGIVLDRGLLSSRLLLLRARDKATPGGKGCVNLDPVRRQTQVQPVELSKFLQTLLGDTLGLPDEQCNVRDKFLLEASLVWINFTHICQLPLSIGEVTESMLVNAWSTGAAFQCVYNQPVIDGFIVGYRGSLDKPFQSSRLITIPWQSKTKFTAAASALACSLTAPFIVPQSGSRYKPWHVVLLMDLAATSSAFGKATGPHCDLTCAKAVRPKLGEEGREIWKSYAEANESEGERYCFNIRGHCAYSYPVLVGVEKLFDTLFMRALSSPVAEFVPYAELMAKASNFMILD